ncbi:hypothetical protein GE061_008852 [Apolygus lucorum]|uniref:Uncharacterized protein n=1 Tax=Apolygus lucorum TaxID=248454 RepID=A0A8S9WNY8_APOLU|nr:hypothetical protein GE061_008852 [Apolygus lucorum]
MEEEIVVKEEAAEDEVKEEVEIKQEVVMGDEDMEEEVGNRWAVEDEVKEEVEIKQEVVMGDEEVEEEVGNRWAVEDEVKEEVEIKQEVEVGDEEVEEEVGNRWAVEDEVKEEVEIKQEVVMGDEEVEEEVRNRWAVEDEVEGDLMIKREDGLTDPLGEESDVLEGSSGVERYILEKEVSCEVMEDGIVVEEEPMSEGDEDQVMEVEIKQEVKHQVLHGINTGTVKPEIHHHQEVLIGDEYVEEEVGNSRTVKDEDAGCPMIKQEDSSAADPLCDESDVLQGSIGVQRSEVGPALMEDGIVVKEEPMSEGDEDQVIGELVLIKQEVLIGDEYVEEEVGNSTTVKDEDAGCPMIKQEDSSAADPLCDESDVLQGSIGVQRSEAGPAKNIDGMTSTVSQLKKFPLESLAAYYSRSEIHFRRTEVEKDDEKALHALARKGEWGSDDGVKAALITKFCLSFTDGHITDALVALDAKTSKFEDYVMAAVRAQDKRDNSAQAFCEEMEEEIVVKEEAAEDEVKEEVEIKQEVVMGDEDVEEEVGNRWAVEDEVKEEVEIKQEVVMGGSFCL